MKKLCVRLFESLRNPWRSLTGVRTRNHDMFLVHNMACFNFGGGWRELLLNNQIQNT